MHVRDRLLRALSPGILAGITARDWLRLLRDNRYDVDATYLPRAAVITLLSLLNSAAGTYERVRFGRAIVDARVDAPLFVLGLARSGTTRLQELLALDERFATPTLYQVRFPHTFLTTEWLLSRLTAPLVPKRRSQDNVRFGWRSAAEEAGAIAILSLCSNQLATAFPRRCDHYFRFATLGDVTSQELDAWRGALLLFLRKLAVRDPRPPILKTPTNTFRVRVLAEMFPDARFVLIQRHPYEIARSQFGMRDAVAPFRRLQKVERHDPAWFLPILGRRAEKGYAELRELPPARLTRLRFEDLDDDPVATLRQVYEQLSLPSFDAVEPAHLAAAEASRRYQRNRHPPLAPDLRERVAREWRVLFEDGGYAP